jgi:nucleoside-diphosphate-sugar epimerase
VIYASSSSVYGDSQKLPKREGEEGSPLSPYALSKLMNEQLADVFGRCFGMQFVGLRYFNVYGPRQEPDSPYAAVIPRFFKACLAGEAPVIYGDGEQSRDFTYVGNVVDATLRAGETAGVSGEIFNVAAGAPATVNAVAETIGSILGKPVRREHLPPRPGDIRDSWADLTKAGRLLGYAPEIDLEDGLRRTIEFLVG